MQSKFYYNTLFKALANHITRGSNKTINFRKVIPDSKRFQENFSGKQTKSGITRLELARVSLNQQVISG